MPARDRVDLWFEREGDLVIGDDGDILDTSAVKGRSLLQEIRTRLDSTRGEWMLNKTIGANLKSYLGEARTASTIGVIVNAMAYALCFDGLIETGDLEIIPLPINRSEVMFRIIVKTVDGELTEDFMYSSEEARFVR